VVAVLCMPLFTVSLGLAGSFEACAYVLREGRVCSQLCQICKKSCLVTLYIVHMTCMCRQWAVPMYIAILSPMALLSGSHAINAPYA
jgi:hypothetical protein